MLTRGDGGVREAGECGGGAGQHGGPGPERGARGGQRRGGHAAHCAHRARAQAHHLPRGLGERGRHRVHEPGKGSHDQAVSSSYEWTFVLCDGFIASEISDIELSPDGVGGGVPQAGDAEVGDGVDGLGHGVDGVHGEVGHLADGLRHHAHPAHGRVWGDDTNTTVYTQDQT